MIDRLKRLTGLKKDKQIAALLGLSVQTFSNRKKRGTLSSAVQDWAVKSGQDAGVILFGETRVKVDPSIPTSVTDVVHEAQTDYSTTPIRLTPREYSLLVLYRQLSEDQQNDTIMYLAHQVDVQREGF